MEESLDINVTSQYNFRGSDYIISLECQGSETMTVQVEDSDTGDQWRASFDATYIEGLTHKTGNFKQFNIFANMLESAVSKASESVNLDLLTYTDLETLRQKKSRGNHSVKPSVQASRSSQLTSKRYLILTYTVEFDRIHYPLPLPYVGKPDPRALQEEVQMLRVEMQKLKHQSGGDLNENTKTEKLLRDIRRLEREKAEIEEEFAAFRREVRTTSNGTAAKDIRALKTMVRNLEEQLMREKTRYQRSTSKRSQEYRDLLEEVEELRASERNLRVRLKSLTTELAMYKRGRTLTRTNSKERASSGDRFSAPRNTSSGRQRSTSNDRLSRGRSGSGSRANPPVRSGSKERPPYLRRSNSLEQISRSSLNGSGSRARSNSFDRNSSANRSRLSTGSGGNHSRSPSPAVSRRFNPTAYIKEKERRNHEATLKKKREQHRSNLSGASGRSRTSANSSRNSGYSQRFSRENSMNSQVSDGYGSDGSYTTRKRLTGTQKWSKESQRRTRLAAVRRYYISCDKDNAVLTARYLFTPEYSEPSSRSIRPPKGKPQKQLASTPEMNRGKTQSRLANMPRADSGDDSDGFDRSAEISEIDERLDRLQQLMKVAMP